MNFLIQCNIAFRQANKQDPRGGHEERPVNISAILYTKCVDTAENPSPVSARFLTDRCALPTQTMHGVGGTNEGGISVKENIRNKAISWLLSLALVLGMIPGLSMTVSADNSHSVIIVTVPSRQTSQMRQRVKL